MRKAVKRVERAFLTAKRPSEGGSCERSSFIPRSIPSKTKDFFESLSSARGWELFSFPPHTIDSATLTVACVACLHRAPRLFVPNSFLSAGFAGYSIRYISRSLRLILRSTHAVIDRDQLRWLAWLFSAFIYTDGHVLALDSSLF